MTVILYYVSLLAGVFIAWTSYGRVELVNLDKNVSVYYMGYNENEISMRKVLIFLVGMLTISIAMIFFKMASSLFTGPLGSFIVVEVLYLISAYYFIDGLSGNYMMILRVFDVNAVTGTLLAVVITIISFISDTLYFRRKI